MNLLVFGASGATGQLVIAQAHAAGHRVTAFVHPPLLTNGPMTASFRVGETLALPGFPSVSRADVAHFMVGTLTASDWVRKRVIIST